METPNPFRLTNPSARDVVVEFDRLVDELMIEGYDKESAEQKAKSMQKEKYGNNKTNSSSE